MSRRNRQILPAVRKLAKDLQIDADSPELRLCEALASTIDVMDGDERVRMLPNHAGPLLKALGTLRERATSAPAGVPDQGLSDAELEAFLSGLESDCGTG